MIAASNYEQHRSGERGSGGLLLAAGHALHTSAARKDEQDWRGNTAGIFAGLPCGAHLMTSQLGGGSHVSPAFFHSIRLATALIAKPVRLHCGGRRRLTVHSRLVGRLSNCRGYSARTLRLDVAHHVCQDKSDTPHRHGLSKSVGFNANRHSERQIAPCSPIRGKRFPR